VTTANGPAADGSAVGHAPTLQPAPDAPLLLDDRPPELPELEAPELDAPLLDGPPLEAPELEALPFEPPELELLLVDPPELELLPFEPPELELLLLEAPELDPLLLEAPLLGPARHPAALPGQVLLPGSSAPQARSRTASPTASGWMALRAPQRFITSGPPGDRGLAARTGDSPIVFTGRRLRHRALARRSGSPARRGVPQVRVRCRVRQHARGSAEAVPPARPCAHAGARARDR
jgi:hypothetical protein